MKLSTYIEHPDQINQLKKYKFDSIIFDLPICSIRSFKPFNWTVESVEQLKGLNFNQLILNLDGIYSDSELAIIKNELKSSKITDYIDGFRIQDPGLISWVKTNFKSKSIELNPETGMQNSVGIEAIIKKNINKFTFNHETEAAVIKGIAAKYKDVQFEIYAQGPILIQYSRRRFLANLYDHNDSTPLIFESEDPELKGRHFTFLDTKFGHFMFAHFHRCLAEYKSKLLNFTNISYLIDARGQSHNYLTTSLHIYTHIFKLEEAKILELINTLKDESQKPQKPGFYLSNNTDYDWRDEQRSNINPVGRILSSQKNDSILLEFFIDIPTDSLIECTNPDQTTGLLNIKQLMDKEFEEVKIIKPFTIYILKDWQKGIQTKGLLYLKDS